MIDLLILSNFASGTNAVHQIVHKIFTNMLKTYFCKLVPGFLLISINLCSNILWTLQINNYQKNKEFCPLVSYNGSFKKGSWPHIPKSL